jgi:MFS family permease
MWFGVQLIWGAVLGVALQARCAQLAGTHALPLYALVATSGAVAAAIAQLLVGPWSDALRRSGAGRAPFYIAGAAAGAAATLAFFMASNATLLLVTFVALQLSLNVAVGPYQAIVPDLLRDEKIAAGSAWIAAMQSAGNALGAVFATLLGTGVLLGVALALVHLAASASTIAHVRGLPAIERARAPLRMRAAFVDLFISRALLYLGFYTLLGYLYFYVRALHAPLDATRASGVAILAFTLVGALGAILAARAQGRDERAIVSAGGVLVALAVGGLALTHTWWSFFPLVVAAGVGWGIFLSADWALACRVVPPHALATAMAVWNLAILLPQIVAPAIASAVISHSGPLLAPNVALGLGSVEVFGGALWIWRLPKSVGGN